MTCRPCASAIVSSSAEYRNGCTGCAARALARCSHMLIVMDKSQPEDVRLQARSDLRQAISRAMPHVPLDEAREAVMSWWRIDESRRGEVPQEGAK